MFLHCHRLIFGKLSRGASECLGKIIPSYMLRSHFEVHAVRIGWIVEDPQSIGAQTIQMNQRNRPIIQWRRKDVGSRSIYGRLEILAEHFHIWTTR